MHPLNRPFELLNRLMPLPREMHTARGRIHPIRYRCLHARREHHTCTARDAQNSVRGGNETRDIKTFPPSFLFDQFDLAYSPRLRTEVSPVGMLNFNLPRVTRSYYLSFGTAISEPAREKSKLGEKSSVCGHDRLTTNKRRDFLGFIKKEPLITQA